MLQVMKEAIANSDGYLSYSVHECEFCGSGLSTVDKKSRKATEQTRPFRPLWRNEEEKKTMRQSESLNTKIRRARVCSALYLM